MLTYLDSLMIENPAFFSQAEIAQLTATDLRSTAVISNNITNAGTILNDAGDIYTQGLSTQRLSADIGNFDLLVANRSNFIDLTAENAFIRNLTAVNVDFRDTTFGDEIENTIYVSIGGNDNNSGRNMFSPLRTIKKACQITHNDYYQSTSTTLCGVPNRNKKYTIFVGTGDYYERNPIYVAPNTSIIGDNLRRTSIYPLHKNYDLFWCNTSVYMWGFTFRGHCEPGACTAFPDFTSSATVTSIALSGLMMPRWSGGGREWRYPYVTTSPYIQGSSSIARMLTAGNNQFPFRFCTVPQVTATLNWDASEITRKVTGLFDNITYIMLNGQDTRVAGSIGSSTGATTWGNVLTANYNFIANETEGFAFALSAQNAFPGMGSYDRSKCTRDVGFILSAIRADIINGNSNESIRNANQYWLHNNGEGTPEVTGNGSQVAATISSIEFAKRLVTSITNYPNTNVPFLGTGAGMRVDGTKAEGFLRSFVLDSFTQFNEGGLGIHILNNGYAQLVSIFTICCTIGLLAETGGQMSVNNSNCSFGLSGIVADGKSLTPVLTGILLNDVLKEPQPDQIYIERADGTIQVPNSTYVSEGALIGVDTRKLVTSPYNGMVFTMGSDPVLYSIRDQPRQVTEPLSATPARPDITPSTPSNRKFQIASANFIFGTTGVPLTAYERGSDVKFYLRSTITTSSHTMEYIGSGILLEQSVPGLGGRANVNNESVSLQGGGTYFTSTDQIGNFRVGTGFTIVQETGLIEGDTFKRAMLALLTPLILSLE